jgi:O-Antigen ligase
MVINAKPRNFEKLPLGLVLFGLTPAIMVLLPWDFGTNATAYRAFLRTNSLAATLAEFAFVLLAMTRGFKPVSALKGLPRFTKVGLLLLSLVVLWTTIFVAAVPSVAVLGIMKYVGHLTFGLAMMHELRGWSLAQREMIWPAIGAGVLSYCLLWAINIAVYHPTGAQWVGLVPSLTNIRWVGFYALAGFCAGLGSLSAKADHSLRLNNVALALLFCTTGLTIALWTGTRSALLAIAIATVVSLLILPLRRQLLIITITSTIFAIVIAEALPHVHPSYGISRIITASVGVSGINEISSSRIDVWMGLVDKVIQKPIAGWGIDQLRFSYPDKTTSIRNPHQAILQLALGTGLTGILAAILIMIPLIKSFPRKFNETYQYPAVAYLFAACAYGLYDGLFYYSYPIMNLLIALCCILTPAVIGASGKSG